MGAGERGKERGEDRWPDNISNSSISSGCDQNPVTREADAGGTQIASFPLFLSLPLSFAPPFSGDWVQARAFVLPSSLSMCNGGILGLTPSAQCRPSDAHYYPHTHTRPLYILILSFFFLILPRYTYYHHHQQQQKQQLHSKYHTAISHTFFKHTNTHTPTHTHKRPYTLPFIWKFLYYYIHSL